MIKYLLLFLLMSPVYAEQYIQVTADIGKDIYPRESWVGELPFELTIAYYNVSKDGWMFTYGYSHQSNVLSGIPFNNEPETVLDKLYIGFGKRFTIK